MLGFQEQSVGLKTGNRTEATPSALCAPWPPELVYTSRLPDEPADGVSDIHLHPTLPRTARLNLIVGF